MRAVGENDTEDGALFPSSAFPRLPAGPPVLCIIVDAEEEFHWGRPVSARNNATSSIRHQKRAQDIFATYKARPTYLVTYPIASNPEAAGALREYLAAGLCDIGAQLHPWVTPPFGASNDERLSFPGNLPCDLEREKLKRLTGAVQDAFHLQPTVYKAGRYGIGPNSAALLEEAGYLVDTSLIPRTRYTDMGGPEFLAFDYGPFWFGRSRRLLELPVTRALTGLAATHMPALYGLADKPLFRDMKFAGILARARILERITLSPEGSDLAAMRRLTRALLKRGQRIFTLSYHSPSLEPGHTPYVRSQRDLAIFLDRLSGFLSFFCDELGGSLLTARELHDWLTAGVPLAAAVPGPRPEPAITGQRRCLVVANTFPPVHGGSAIVYDSLARFGGGRVSVLAPRVDYRNGQPVPGWREFDRAAPFRVHRIHLLRTLLLPESAHLLQRLGGLSADLVIRVSILWAIRRIVRAERIAIVCIGELVAGGWLARACQMVFGLRSLIYVHGEEISTRTRYDENGQRRRRALASANGVVAVSRFTRDVLIDAFGVPAGKIQLISNGVDLARFTPRPRSAALMARYGLNGRRVLLTISRLYARKGMDRVIESLITVRQHIPDIVYLVVGEGAYRPMLEHLVALHDLQAHVVFAGAVPSDELADHYSLGDVFIMANREMPDGETEGFGLVFLEANACGLPVIAGQAGGSVDAVSDQVNGLLVDGTDVAAIAEAIVRVFEDENLRAKLQAGGAEVAGAAGWQRRVELFLEFCDEIAKAGGAHLESGTSR
ncbi:MAG TPA: glycosyltransferase [Rhodopila sp.]|nr:glycosyltransferase [Rhodopila sp.]